MSINRKKQKRARLRNKKTQERRRVTGLALRAERILGDQLSPKARWSTPGPQGITGPSQHVARVGDRVEVFLPNGQQGRAQVVTHAATDSSRLSGINPGGAGGSGIVLGILDDGPKVLVGE